jgi:hypothetical protein
MERGVVVYIIYLIRICVDGVRGAGALFLLPVSGVRTSSTVHWGEANGFNLK